MGIAADASLYSKLLTFAGSKEYSERHCAQSLELISRSCPFNAGQYNIPTSHLKSLPEGKYLALMLSASSGGCKLRVLSLLRNRLLTRGLCQILVDLSPIVGVSWEFNFCMLILTVGSRLCTFCKLHLQTLQNHCCAVMR